MYNRINNIIRTSDWAYWTCEAVAHGYCRWTREQTVLVVETDRGRKRKTCPPPAPSPQDQDSGMWFDMTEDKTAFQSRLWVRRRERMCSYQLMSDQPLQQLQQTSSITQVWEQILHRRLPCLKHKQCNRFNTMSILSSSVWTQNKTLTAGNLTVSFCVTAVRYRLINWNYYYISFDLWTVFGR